MQRPLPKEYNPYFENYISLVGDGDFFEMLYENKNQFIRFINGIPADKHDYRYAPDKWSIKDILQHIVDTERVMAYRALVAARGDNGVVMPVMTENLYAHNANASLRTVHGLLEEFNIVRQCTELLLYNLTPEQTELEGNAAGFPITARAVGYIVLGHVLHHINVITERYLS